MSERQAVLLALKSYYRGIDQTEYDTESDWKTVTEISKRHKLFPIVFCQYRDAVSGLVDGNTFLKMKNEVMSATVTQITNDIQLFKICEKLDSAGIAYSVCKGAACRAMYSQPDYRISCDEDILVERNDFPDAERVFCEDGYEQIIRNNIETVFVKNMLEIELQKHFVGYFEKFDEINEIIYGGIKSGFYIEYSGKKLRTLPPDCNFLLLCLHFFKHFIRGGIGIRQLMDIVKFTDINKAEIDFDYCFGVLKDISADKLIKTVLKIGNKYFDTDFSVDIGDADAEELLDDIFDSGAYGNSESEREHSGAVTQKMVFNGGGRIKTLKDVILPDKRSVARGAPDVDSDGKLFKYRAKRLINALTQKNKYKALKISLKRQRLMKKMGIY